jgi:hypothetical protein
MEIQQGSSHYLSLMFNNLFNKSHLVPKW